MQHFKKDKVIFRIPKNTNKKSNEGYQWFFVVTGKQKAPKNWHCVL